VKVYIQALSALFWVIWPLSTLAAGVTIGNTLGDVPLSAWVVVLVLSAISGVMALLQRMSAAMVLEQQLGWALPEDRPAIERALAGLALPKGWRLFVTWHMAGAVLTGVMTFLLLQATTMNDYLEAVAIALASYGGARLFDKVSVVFNDRVLDALRKKAD
jgi:hypothetical protein